MPFCYSPWTNLDISPVGDMAPCCKFITNKYPDRFNIRQYTLEQYKHSDFLNNVKQQMLGGEWPQGCERCQIEEDNNIPSKRQLDHDRWHEHYERYDLDSNKFITASLAFGNTCNLKCITCGPHSSSKWHKEYFDLSGISVRRFDFFRDNFVDTFVSENPKIIHLDIPGGEPFLSGVLQQHRLLDLYIQSDQAKNISLHYTTNATIYPDESWWSLWRHFREIDLQVSVDGIGNRFEYIRFPALWSQFTNNVDRYLEAVGSIDNFRLSVSHTVSAYNIFYLDEFFEWCYNKGLPEPWLGRVHRPEHMRPSVWPNAVRENMAGKLLKSRYHSVKIWANSMVQEDDSIYFKKFQEMCAKHDNYRGLDFKRTFPEIAQFL